MAESKADADAKALESWYKSLLDQVVKEMIRLKAVTGTAVQATPVWMVPHQILIAKVWGIGHENDFVWSVSVDKLIADYVAGSLAATPRDVARHFSLKWQMDADRLLNLEKNKLAVEKADASMQAFSTKLVEHAEILYDMANRDDVWQERQTLVD
jgi:hypothetical protein